MHKGIISDSPMEEQDGPVEQSIAQVNIPSINTPTGNELLN